MDNNKIAKQVIKIYKDYDGYFHNKYEYNETKSYCEGNIFRQKDDLYLVLDNVSGIIPTHDLTLYCKIPKNKNELEILMNKLGYIKDYTQQMDLKTLKIVYKHLEDRLAFLDKNRPNSKSIIGMELACQYIFDMIAGKDNI